MISLNHIVIHSVRFDAKGKHDAVVATIIVRSGKYLNRMLDQLPCVVSFRE